MRISIATYTCGSGQSISSKFIEPNEDEAAIYKADSFIHIKESVFDFKHKSKSGFVE